MKKTLIYWALSMVAVAISSCSSSEEPDGVVSADDYICFGQPTVNLNATIDNFANTNHNTRSNLVDDINQFQVWGFCVPNNVEGNQIESASPQEWNDKSIFFTSDNCGDVFHNMTVKNSGNEYADYQYSQTSKWRKWNDNENALYTFIAGYVPTGLGSFSMEKSYLTTETDQNGNNKSHGPRLTFTISQTSDNLATPLDHNKQPDAMIATTYDLLKSNGRVSLSFFHFMTGIRFKFDNYSDKKLVIKKVTYAGRFHKSATFDFTTDTPVMSVTGKYAGTFTLLDSHQEIEGGASDYMGGDDPVTLLLLPNPDGTTIEDTNYTLGKDKTIEIVYSFDGGADKTFTLPEFTLNYKPEPNTKHTAHFNFVGDEFIVMFQADDELNWQNGSDNNFTIK